MTIAELIQLDQATFAGRASLNQEAQGNPINTTIDIIKGKHEGNFNFDETPEGSEFWTCVYEGDFEAAQEILDHQLHQKEIDKIKKVYRSKDTKEEKPTVKSSEPRYTWMPLSSFGPTPTTASPTKKSFSVGEWLDKQNLDKDSVHTFTYQGLFDLLAEFKMYLND